jgi:hypothetical protein
MLSREDFEEVLASIDRSKSIPTRLRELDIDEKELHVGTILEWNYEVHT